MSGLLVVMGSGETAPTMVKPHRAIFERVGERPAVMLDTPYGFQSNASDISARAVGYFAASVGRAVEVVSWRVAPPPGLVREKALSQLRTAGWVFAGPGSPTFALRQWRDTPIPDVFRSVLAGGGVVTLASAAALTLGSHTVPVYEIYKAGLDPFWDTGLNLVEEVCGLPAVVIPHYDNAEGGHHDTRFCYLGEDRLSFLERQLPEASFILGVDEHTAVLFDPDSRTASVVGNGRMTARRNGHSVVHPTGSVVSFDALWSESEAAPSAEASSIRPPVAAASAEPTTRVATSLQELTDATTASFAAALQRRDVDGCVEAVLALEQAMVDWSTDTNESDEADNARAALRSMVVRLGELAAIGARDPRTVVGPFVSSLLELRERARAARDFALSDWVRDRLVAAGVEVRDTATGAQWQLNPLP